MAHRFSIRWQWLWLFGLSSICLLSLLFPAAAANGQDLSIRWGTPSASHWLGTDQLGRDLLLRLLRSGAVSLSVGFSAAALSIGVGVAVGTASGYGGGFLDRILMGTVDVLYALPVTLLTLLFLVFFGKGLPVLCLAIGLTGWFTFARVVRARTLDLRKRTFILAARGLGQSHCAVILRHVLPNLFPVVGDYALLLIPNAVLMEAFLSFLGLGVPPPHSSWGSMIVESVPVMGRHPLQLLWPTFLLVVTLLALTTLRQETVPPIRQ
ncbi:MAG: ABC transporter permease [Puniceicoccales bacterium]|jgi:oligopeptide transport system permease protein|nr:ABC transporter permease [Puniceicoccales bacterium]